jgi:hypothetical protein
VNQRTKIDFVPSLYAFGHKWARLQGGTAAGLNVSLRRHVSVRPSVPGIASETIDNRPDGQGVREPKKVWRRFSGRKSARLPRPRAGGGESTGSLLNTEWNSAFELYSFTKVLNSNQLVQLPPS